MAARLTEDGEVLDKFSDWYGFDTENDETGKVTLACLVHESGSRNIWKEAGKFVEWCDQINSRGKATPMVICHNLEYDLVNEFGPRYADLQLNYLKGRLISAKYGRISFWDSFNHFRMSLKKLGQDLGIEKKDMDIYDEEYVATDAWIALQAMVHARDYIASIGGRIGATSGSSSVSVWRTMTDDAYVYGAVDTPWLRKGYYGARTEIFCRFAQGKVIGDGPDGPIREKSVRGYDINSMYPFCMIDDFPEYHCADMKMDREKGMAEVIISIPLTMEIGPLVYRAPVTGRLSFPVGLIQGVWTYDEIRYAESLGCKVVKVIEAHGCDSLVRPFDEFITTVYEKRKASKSSSEKLMLKVLMNSLYGKIASKCTVTRTVSKYEMLRKNNPRIKDVKWINHTRGLLDFTTPPPDYVNVMWGAMITANARILLTKYLMGVPPEKLLYADTDSIYCIDHLMPTSNELGALKLEKEATMMHIKQPKVYRVDDDYTAKGVPKARYDKDGALVVDFAEQFFEDGQTQFSLPIRFRESLNSKRGKANQWINKSKKMLKEFDGKPLSGNRFFPPVIGMQTDLFSQDGLPKSKGNLNKKHKTS